MFETSMAITDVSELNTWVGFAVDDYADSELYQLMVLVFSTFRRYNYNSTLFLEKMVLPTSFDMPITLVRILHWYQHQTATQQVIPTNSVRLGFVFEPAGTDSGQTVGQFKIYMNGPTL